MRLSRQEAKKFGIHVAREENANQTTHDMNATEERYAAHLEFLRAAGDIIWWKFGAIRLHLGSGAWFKPDFAVVTLTGAVEFHEIKGFQREAAIVRWKVAAFLFPFRFLMIAWRKGEWVTIRESGK